MAAPKSSELSLGARVVDGIRWRLGRIGIHITPFITFREDGVILEPAHADGQFSLSEVTATDIEELIRLEPHYTPERLLAWFADGRLCFGLRDGSRLVAKMWCDLKEMSYSPAFRKLEKGEAYMFDAYSDPAYRGRNLAPTLRSAFYAELRRRGFSRFYSHSGYFNLPARRFKRKLGAVEEDLRIQFGLFGKWSRTFTIKRYR